VRVAREADAPRCVSPGQPKLDWMLTARREHCRRRTRDARLQNYPPDVVRKHPYTWCDHSRSHASANDSTCALSEVSYGVVRSCYWVWFAERAFPVSKTWNGLPWAVLSIVMVP
jgi:hypothetical protein